MREPPFTLTPGVLELAIGIGELLGQLRGLAAVRPQPRLRKENRVRTVQGTVAIEGNQLSTEQVTAVLEGKRVIGPHKEIREVLNALAAYERAPGWKPWSQKDLLGAHGVLMHGLIPDAGRWRKGGVGVVQGAKVAHVAPPPSQVPRLMAELLEWGAKADVPPLIKSSVVHYEIQFIHPFSDGNGRLGRLWQHVILLAVSPVFESVPVESITRSRQAEYYSALGESDRAGDSTRFLEFSLTALRDALQELLEDIRPEREDAEARLQAAREAFGSRSFSRSDYLKLHKRLSTATASRDLKEGVERGTLARQGEKRMARYVFKR
jgi:Fic family protein